jgi:hypothetical protein
MLMRAEFAATHNYSAIIVSICEMREHRLPGRANRWPNSAASARSGDQLGQSPKYCAETTMPRFRQNSRRFMMEIMKTAAIRCRPRRSRPDFLRRLILFKPDGK